MQVIQYLKQNSLGQLAEEFAIKVKEYEAEGLIVLNYNQIDSPKSHPVVMECRGLIIDYDFNVVSRSFDRFFNYGEQPETQSHIDMNLAECMDKVDGSLIKLYWWGDRWNISTRGSAFAEGNCAFGDSFNNLALKAMDLSDGEFALLAADSLHKDWTYIAELTCAENRIVKAYSGYTLHYLASRNNKTFEYGDGQRAVEAGVLGCASVKRYRFDSMESCIEVSKTLKNLDEGYVLYQGGTPVCKIKSPAYVAVHHIRGEGLSPKRICQLVLTGEQDEYLSYFEEDRKFFVDYIAALQDMKEEMGAVYAAHQAIESQKDFALAVKDFPFSGILFSARKMKISVEDAFAQQTDAYKIRMLSDAVGVEIEDLMAA